MATPIYAGSAHAPATSGWLGGLGSWFGIATPAYVGAGQPASNKSGYFSGTTPAYKVAPPSQAQRITLVVPRDVIDPQQ